MPVTHEEGDRYPLRPPVFADVAQRKSIRLISERPTFRNCPTVPILSRWCNGSITVSKTVCQGSSPWGYAKSCNGGRAAQCNGLQIRKTVSSNLTRCSKFRSLTHLDRVPVFETGSGGFESCRAGHIKTHYERYPNGKARAKVVSLG